MFTALPSGCGVACGLDRLGDGLVVSYKGKYYAHNSIVLLHFGQTQFTMLTIVTNDLGLLFKFETPTSASRLVRSTSYSLEGVDSDLVQEDIRRLYDLPVLSETNDDIQMVRFPEHEDDEYIYETEDKEYLYEDGDEYLYETKDLARYMYETEDEYQEYVYENDIDSWFAGNVANERP
ncbi:hypothetical protein BASA81_002635 [Batrachochytrium salamandrivorans]|nr:hypothetical protein BASA81_002635 [Batrachochytrium salamandrivorans]